MPTPKWFQARDYFYNKLAQMNTSNADYTAEDLAKAFNEAGYTIASPAEADINAAASQLYRHFEDWGNAENVSPNGYFIVADYMANKIDQLNKSGQTPPDNFSEWNNDSLNAAMQQAGIESYWDHYILYGTAEGINPSAAFDTEAYLAAKADQLNNLPEGQQQPLPDGTLGKWDAALVATALQQAGLNAIEHYYDYGKAEGVQYEPLPEPGPVLPEVPIVAGQQEYTDGGQAVNFAGKASDLANTATITGTGNDDELSLTMGAGDFGGLTRGSMSGVPTVNLNSTDHVVFYANNITDASTYNLDGSISLRNLNEDVKNINLSNADQAVDFGLTTAAQKGDTTINLGLDNVVGPEDANDKPTPVEIFMDGVETVNVNSTGKVENMVNLSGVKDMATMNVAGDADLKVTAIDSKLATINASEATGDISVNAGNGGQLTTFTGGQGSDTVTYGKGTSGTIKTELNGVETIELNNTGNVTVNGKNMTGVETIALKEEGSDASPVAVKLQNLGDTLAVTASKENYANVTAAKVDHFSLNVAEDSTYNGNLVLADTTLLDINAEGYSDEAIDGKTPPANVVLNNGSNLQKVTHLTVTGAGDVDTSAYSKIGSKANSLYVDTTGSEGTFGAHFAGGSTDNLFVYGGDSGANGIKVGTSYDFVQINSGSANDTINMSDWTETQIKAATIEMNLGGGTDYVMVKDAAAAKALLAAAPGLEADQVKTGKEMAQLYANGTISIDGEQIVIPDLPENFNYTVAAGTSLDASRVSFEDPTQVVNWTMMNNSDLTVGELTAAANGAPATTVNMAAANTPNGSASFTYTGVESGAIILNTGAVAKGTSGSQDPKDPVASSDATISITNSGGNELILTPDNVTINDGTNDFNVGFAGIKELNLNVENGSTISMPTGVLNTVETTNTAANTLLTGLTNANFAGQGNVNIINTQFGTTTVAKLTVDASQLEGKLNGGTEVNGSTNPAMLAAQQVIFKGAMDDTSIATTITAGTAAAQPDLSEFTFQEGNDLLYLNLVGGATKAANAKITLADDNATDTIQITSVAAANLSSSTVTITGFDFGEDALQNLKSTDDSSVDYNSLTADNIKDYLGLADTSGLQVVDSTLVLYDAGNDTLNDGIYDVYALLGTKNAAGAALDTPTFAKGSVTGAGAVLVCLQGVNMNDATLSSVQWENFADPSTIA